MNLLSTILLLLPSSFRHDTEQSLHIRPVSLGSFQMDDFLFPKSYNYTHAWTTSKVVDMPFVEHVNLDDASLNTHRISIAPQVDNIPNTTVKAWRAFYPEGGVNPQSDTPSGFGFYMSGPKGFKDSLPSADEVIFGYRVTFQEGWGYAKGGKLPGAFGGEGSSAYRCTGGLKEGRNYCFNLRLMWRQEGIGELYAYLPFHDENTAQLTNIPPKSIQNPDYGFSVGRGSFKFNAGVKGNIITERIKLNEIGLSNGEIEIRMNGDTVIMASGLVIRTSSDSFIRGLHFQTFFGGHGKEWASPKDQYAWFSDISGAIIART